MNLLMTQLRAKNPQIASQISNAMNSGSNPQEIIKQMLGNANQEQIKSVLNQAKQFGVPEDILKQVQNIK